MKRVGIGTVWNGLTSPGSGALSDESATRSQGQKNNTAASIQLVARVDMYYVPMHFMSHTRIHLYILNHDLTNKC